MNLLVFDLETTGLSSDNNGIVSISAKLFDSKRNVLSSFNDTCRPKDVEIDLGALKVNKYTLSAIDLHKDEKIVLSKFCDWLLTLKVDGELVLGGHNIAFDIGFIKARLKKYDIVGFDQAVSYRVIDTASLGRFLVLTGVVPANVKASLKELALALQVDYDKDRHHTSEYDVDLTARLLFKMIDVVKDRLYGEN